MLVHLSWGFLLITRFDLDGLEVDFDSGEMLAKKEKETTLIMFSPMNRIRMDPYWFGSPGSGSSHKMGQIYFFYNDSDP
jgi:hypothetical protein